MLQSLYTALVGMRSNQYRIDVIGNNMANINTTAFTSSRVDFSEALYAAMKPQQQAAGTLINGSGALVGATQRITEPGAYIATGSPLDFLLDGPGYFKLGSPDGQMVFSRDGAFHVSVVGGNGYLVTADGYYVLGADNRPIRTPAGSAELTADPDGNLYSGGVRIATLGIAAFPNPEGLINVGGNMFAASDGSGTMGAATGTLVRQGWLEGSNVDLTLEMAKLLEAQRAYSVLGSAIRTVDEMETTANRIGE